MKSILFAIFLVIISFLVSYITDLIEKRKIVWWPNHGREMASGTFFSGFIAYLLFEHGLKTFSKTEETP